MASNGHLTFVVGVVTCALAGCESRKLPTPPTADLAATLAQPDVGAIASAAPRIVKDEGPQPTATTPIATAGEFQVTVADFDEASAVSLLFAPNGQTELAPEQLALPHVHLTMTQSLLSQKVIRAELERREIRPSSSEINAYLRDHPRLRSFGQHIDDPEALAESLKPIGLEPRQLFRVAWDELGNKMLASALMSEIDDDEIWNTYEFQHTTRTAAIVAGRNTPTSNEIDAWMAAHPDEIDAHFQANQSRYRTPKRVRLHIVKPAGGESITVEKLKKAAELLEKGVQPATIAKELELQHELDAQLVRGENPRAFAMSPGDVGWTDGGARGAYAWKVVGFHASQIPELTRPLRREISSELLRTTSVVASLEEKLDRAAQLIAQPKLTPRKPGALPQAFEQPSALQQKVEAIDGLAFQVSTFPHSPAAPLPNHGLAEKVIEQTFRVEIGTTTDPFLSRERGFVLRVVGATTADREQFDANIEEHRKAFYAAIEPRVVPQWVERRLEELGAEIDVKPLRIKYGVLQKDRNARE